MLTMLKTEWQNLRSTEAWRSIFRSGNGDSNLHRAQAVQQNVFLHLFSVKIRSRALEFRSESAQHRGVALNLPKRQWRQQSASRASGAAECVSPSVFGQDQVARIGIQANLVSRSADPQHVLHSRCHRHCADVL